MTTSQLESDEYIAVDKRYYDDKIAELYDPSIRDFKDIIKEDALIKAIACGLCTCELIFILLSLPFLAKTSTFAVSLAVFTLSVFVFGVLRFYLNTKKPRQLVDLRNKFLNNCKNALNYQEGRSDHHIALAGASCKFGAALKGIEYNLYTVPKKIRGFFKFISKKQLLGTCKRCS